MKKVTILFQKNSHFRKILKFHEKTESAFFREVKTPCFFHFQKLII